jgi:hypothetical protein
MGSIFNGGGGGGGGSQQTVQYAQPPAPGTIQQTILSGSPDPNPSRDDPMDYIQRQRKQALGRLTDALGLASGSLGGG